MEKKILKSWKDIASYLGVGVRTAQRWKCERGLPVKQPGATRRSAVLAMCDEIDRWLLDSASSRLKRETERPELADIVATDILWSRPSRPRSLEREVEALLDVGCLMAHHDQKAVLQKIAGYALAFCKAESAGFSIVETAEDGRGIFRWTGTCGRMRPFEGGTTPIDFSPCGVCLERNSPQLFKYPEKFYLYLRPIAPIAELLLIPMHSQNAWLGTIWVLSHEERRKFDREDARVMSQLGSLASATYFRNRVRSLATES